MTTQPHHADGQWLDPSSGYVDTLHNGVSEPMSLADLERVTGGHDDDREWCSWIEYRLNGETMHRSVRLHLKTGLFADGQTASFA